MTVEFVSNFIYNNKQSPPQKCTKMIKVQLWLCCHNKYQVRLQRTTATICRYKQINNVNLLKNKTARGAVKQQRTVNKQLRMKFLFLKMRPKIFGSIFIICETYALFSVLCTWIPGSRSHPSFIVNRSYSNFMSFLLLLRQLLAVLLSTKKYLNKSRAHKLTAECVWLFCLNWWFSR